MDCRVVVEAAIPVYDVGTADEAVRIAISKTGDMLNPDLNYVEINMGERSCPHCDEDLEPAFVAADEALVALELEMTVFNVADEEHASRIVRKEIGQRMQKVPLEVLHVDVIEEDEDEAEGDDGGDGGDAAEESSPEESASDDADGSGGGDEDDDVLPEFEELIDEN